MTTTTDSLVADRAELLRLIRDLAVVHGRVIREALGRPGQNIQESALPWRVPGALKDTHPAIMEHGAASRRVGSRRHIKRVLKARGSKQVTPMLSISTSARQ